MPLSGSLPCHVEVVTICQSVLWTSCDCSVQCQVVSYSCGLSFKNKCTAQYIQIADAEESKFQCLWLLRCRRHMCIKKAFSAGGQADSPTKDLKISFKSQDIARYILRYMARTSFKHRACTSTLVASQSQHRSSHDTVSHGSLTCAMNFSILDTEESKNIAVVHKTNQGATKVINLCSVESTESTCFFAFLYSISHQGDEQHTKKQCMYRMPWLLLSSGYSGKDLWKLKQERPELFGVAPAAARLHPRLGVWWSLIPASNRTAWEKNGSMAYHSHLYNFCCDTRTLLLV